MSLTSLLGSKTLVAIALLGATSGLQAPRTLSGHALVYSSAYKAVLLVGGDEAGKTPLMKWTGSKWVTIPNSESLSRSLAGVATDDDGNLTVFGGAVGQEKDGGSVDWKVQNSLVRWDGKAWSTLASSGPAPRDHCSMVYDSDRKVFVLFGGSDADPSERSLLYGDTWEWDGKSWTKRSESGPAARAHQSMVYDPVRKVTLMVGGNTAKGPDGKTWAWDGKTWEAIASGMPAYLSSPRLAYFKKIGKVVLFGGDIRLAVQTGTWLWDGKAWEELKIPGPPGRTVHGLAYDESRDVVVLYGGYSTEVLGDTWEFDGKVWTKQ